MDWLAFLLYLLIRVFTFSKKTKKIKNTNDTQYHKREKPAENESLSSSFFFLVRGEMRFIQNTYFAALSEPLEK